MQRLQNQPINGKRPTFSFHAVGDPEEILISDEQAAKLMGVCLETFEELESIGEGPRNSDGFITLSDISFWVESRYKKFSEAKQNEVCCIKFSNPCS